jgi:hypothetical protein
MSVSASVLARRSRRPRRPAHRRSRRNARAHRNGGGDERAGREERYQFARQLRERN